MFTGLIAGCGTISAITRRAQTLVLTIQAPPEVLLDYQVGDSLAINGVCLTAIQKKDNQLTVDLMPERFQRTTFATLRVGSVVNLERALLLSERVEGHLVAGHVDTTTRLLEKRTVGNAQVLTFQYPVECPGEIIPQGSVALNGVSLTVTEVTARSFSIGLIPHSQQETNLVSLVIGEHVNLETDLIGKYLNAQYRK